MSSPDALTTVLTQTNYTKEQAMEQLEIHHGDFMKVIRNFLKIPDKKPEILSPKQEMFRQMRQNLDISKYWEANPVNINHVAESFQEEEANKQSKPKQIN